MSRMSAQLPHTYECELEELTLEYASTVAPAEFGPAWAWYQGMEGEVIPRLPRGKDAPKGLPIKIAAQRGIHVPTVADIAGGWHNGRTYAITIYSSGGSRYEDKAVVWRPDGTWLLDYRAQKTEEGRSTQWDQNRPLVNCLEDGVPVGVMVKQPRGGYLVLGLGYVERYNELTGIFTLHGPVNPATEARQTFCSFVGDTNADEELKRLQDLKRLALIDGDDKLRAYTRIVRRQRQDKFRDAVLAAYDGRCAVCDTGVYEVLQAAHIDDFRGRQSQIVQNGILLRADIHLLYDANLIGIEPGSHRIVLPRNAELGAYERLEGAQIRLPREASLRPDDELLEMHFKRFRAQHVA